MSTISISFPQLLTIWGCLIGLATALGVAWLWQSFNRLASEWKEARDWAKYIAELYAPDSSDDDLTQDAIDELMAAQGIAQGNIARTRSRLVRRMELENDSREIQVIAHALNLLDVCVDFIAASAGQQWSDNDGQ